MTKNKYMTLRIGDAVRVTHPGPNKGKVGVVERKLENGRVLVRSVGRDMFDEADFVFMDWTMTTEKYFHFNVIKIIEKWSDELV